MDTTDIKILELLQQDARITMSEISSRLNLSLPAVSKRVAKLEKSNAIRRYTAILEPETFSKNLSCFCLIVLRNKSAEGEGHFKDFIESHPDILECHCISGEYEFLLKIVTESPKTLERVLVQLRRETSVIRNCSFVVLSTMKESPSIAPSIVE